MAAIRVQCWCLEVSAYSYEVRHRPTAKLRNVDSLSRLPLDDQGQREDNSTEAKAI